MRDVESFSSPEILDSFLADKLNGGSLALVLGAGISAHLNLPDWKSLLADLSARLSTTVPAGLAPDEEGEVLLAAAGKNRVALAEHVRKVLYAKVDRSFGALLSSPLLAALGALAMPSRRGSTSNIITFNFDDLLETYLGYYGFAVQAVDRMPVWNSRADVRVLHPHGLLASDPNTPATQGIVIARSDYDRIVNDKASPWHAVLRQVLSSHTCIFLGLSGADANLTSLLQLAKDIHPATTQQHAFWGVRVSDDPGDPRRSAWEDRGVFHKVLDSYSDLPSWLRGICQRAARSYTLA
jgi:hypothetical protein